MAKSVNLAQNSMQGGDITVKRGRGAAKGHPKWGGSKAGATYIGSWRRQTYRDMKAREADDLLRRAGNNVRKLLLGSQALRDLAPYGITAGQTLTEDVLKALPDDVLGAIPVSPELELAVTRILNTAQTKVDVIVSMLKKSRP